MSDQSGTAGTTPVGVRPSEATIAGWIAIGGGALTALFGVLLMAGVGVPETDAAGKAVPDGAGVFIGVIVLIIAAIYIFCGLQLHKGRNWARIVLTVFAALGVLAAFPQFNEGGTQTVSAILNLVIGIALLVLLWMPKTRAWISSHT